MASSGRRILAALVVAIHAVVVALHGWAHSELGVELTFGQELYAGVVIVAAPVAAAVLVWSRWRTAGFLLLAVSMAGSLLFGLYHHFVAISPDHVAHLPGGDAQGLFRWTAVLLAASEAWGTTVGWLGARLNWRAP